MSSLKPRHIIIGIACLIIAASLTLGGFFLFRGQPEPTPPAVSEPVEPAPGTEPPYNFDYSWAESSPYIAHAFGAISGATYTNSYEAFLLNYQLGHRIFEVDFAITNDERTVLAHDAESWRSRATVKSDSDIEPYVNPDPAAFTYNNFMSSLWYDKYHPLDVEGLLRLLQDYPDVYIVTDTKYLDKEHVQLQFSEFVNTARNLDEALLDRFIPQIYLPEMLDYIMELYPWKSVIYTLYANAKNWTPENVLEFSRESGVKFITMWGSWSDQDTLDLWHDADIKVAAHTVNDLSSVAHLRSLGIDLFYTDFLLP